MNGDKEKNVCKNFTTNGKVRNSDKKDTATKKVDDVTANGLTESEY